MEIIRLEKGFALQRLHRASGTFRDLHNGPPQEHIVRKSLKLSPENKLHFNEPKSPTVNLHTSMERGTQGINRRPQIGGDRDRNTERRLTSSLT